MLYWALVFFLVAIVAGLFGFGGIASASAGIAQILFFVFLVLLVISLVWHLMRGVHLLPSEAIASASEDPHGRAMAIAGARAGAGDLAA